MRGFLGGVAIGALVSGLGAALVSLAVPFPKTIQVTSENPPTATVPDDPSLQVLDEVATVDADLVEVAPVPPVDPDTELHDTVLDQATLAPAGKPDISGVEEALDLDEVTPGTMPDVSAESAPVSPSGRPLTNPDAPSPEAAPVIETTSAPLPPDDPAPISREDAPDLAEAPPAEEPPLTAAEPEQEIGTSGVPETEAAHPASPAAPEVPDAPQPTAPQIVADVPEVTTPDLEISLPGLTLPQVTDRPEIRDLPSQDEDDLAAAALPGDAGRLRVGTPGAQLGSQSADTAQADGTDGARPAFVRNSEEFIALDDRPLMSIVLIDGVGSVGTEALADFPYPLSFALDPEDPKVAEKAAAHRAAGFEVLMLVDLPRAAGPREAEAAMEVWASKLPQAVGVLEGIGTGFQGNRALADQVAALSAAAGLGLVTQAKGLNTVAKLAQRDGVPSGVVFRDFDGAGQDPRAMRRFLDQAAFRAGQEGAVIMLGRLQPDTVSALLLWGLQDRASRVQLAPVSASLQTWPTAQ